MKKNKGKNEYMVQGHHEVEKSEKGHLSSVGRYATESSDEGRKPEKMWFVQFAQIRRHSRVLYVPIDSTIVRMFRLKKGDVLKFMLLELRRSPSENEPIPASEETTEEEGEL